jgi:hypothetical protein
MNLFLVAYCQNAFLSGMCNLYIYTDAVLFVKQEPDGNDNAGAEESKFVEQPHHIVNSEEVSPQALKSAHEESLGLLQSEDGKRATAV